MNARPLRTFASTSLRAALVLEFLLGPLLISALNVNISATVPDNNPPQPPTQVRFIGIAYPSSQVTILKNGSLEAAVPADPQARFDVTLTLSAGGTFTFTLFSEDAQGLVGRSSNFTLSITEGTTTTVSGVFLGPTISIDQPLYQLGDTITMLGTTAPASDVTILVTSDVERSFQASADSTGVWRFQTIATTLGIGTHNARAKAVAPTNEISGFSTTLSFGIEADDPCDGKRPGDLNCNGRVNLQDFSILLFFWKTTVPSNPRADINQDGIVNIRDLSILLFWWTG